MKTILCGSLSGEKKAFDVVPHNILLNKLKKIGITGNALHWFASYLSSRTQKVEING
jgi:methylaspartate ammonia-lyase